MSVLTPTMKNVLATAMRHGGTLERHQGGYWSYQGCRLYPHNGAPEWYASTPTVEALVKRGEMEYSKWQVGKKGKFPIEADVVGPGSSAVVPMPRELVGAEG